MTHNSKETNYLKVVRTEPITEEPITEQQNEFIYEKKKLTFREKIEWRGIEPSTIIISGIAYLTVVIAMCVLLAGAVFSLI